MAEFRFKVGSRRLKACCERKGRRLVLEAEGRRIEFEPVSLGSHLVHLRLEGRVVPAWVARSDGSVFVSVAGETYRFDADTGGPDLEAGDEKAFAPGAHTLKVPMPGIVSKVLVAAGEGVDANQPLVVLEAMKMENSVLAPAHCRIGRVHVVEGDPVGLGDPLLDMIV